MSNLKKTFFIDIDGTILTHAGNINEIWLRDFNVKDMVPDMIQKLNKWFADDHMIVLTTARSEPMRKKTEEILEKLGIPYHLLIMGLRCGPRIVINDLKPMNNDIMATGYNLKRHTIPYIKDDNSISWADVHE